MIEPAIYPRRRQTRGSFARQGTMACDNCTDLIQTIEVQRPSDLEMVLRVVQANLTDGTLVPAPISGSVVPPVAIQKLNPAGPWPDAIESGFRCTGCGQCFRLGVETYHGAGGNWRRL